MVRLVLTLMAASAVVFSQGNPVDAGLWEKFWAKKHAHHNSARGVKHNHYHHHRAHKDCGGSWAKPCQSSKPCNCKHHASTAPTYPPPVYQTQSFQPEMYSYPAQPPVQQTYVPPPLPPAQVSYPPPAPVVQPPVAVATPTVSWQNVNRLEYRLQPQVQSVPVTCQKTVTVDEGSWHKVWVPKPVVKQVAQTVYQQQTVYQPVLHQVSQQIPQYNYVARQSVTQPWCYPSANWLGYGCPPSMPAAISPSMNYSVQPSTLAPLMVPGPRAPVTLGREIEPLESLDSMPLEQTVPEPRADATYGNLTPVSPAASGSSPARAASSGMFVPAPSAASLWRARQSTRMK